MRALPATTSYAVGFGVSSFTTPTTHLRSRRFVVKVSAEPSDKSVENMRNSLSSTPVDLAHIFVSTKVLLLWLSSCHISSGSVTAPTSCNIASVQCSCHVDLSKGHSSSFGRRSGANLGKE